MMMMVVVVVYRMDDMKHYCVIECLNGRIRRLKRDLMDAWWMFETHCFCGQLFLNQGVQRLVPIPSHCARLHFFYRVKNASVKRLASRFPIFEPTSWALAMEPQRTSPLHSIQIHFVGAFHEEDHRTELQGRLGELEGILSTINPRKIPRWMVLTCETYEKDWKWLTRVKICQENPSWRYI